MKPIRGFTLVELMITVVVIAILAAVAVPSYRNYVMRAQRTDARATLLRVQANEEKFFLQNNTYTNQLGTGGLNLINTAATTMPSENGKYDVTVTVTDGGAGYSARATPRSGGGQTSDSKCTSFTITHAGKKDATGSDAANCWK